MGRKVNEPSEMRSREWRRVDAQLRERAFFMAGVANARELQKWRSVVERVASGAMSAGQAREEMRRYLEKTGYKPEPGLEGTIKDRSTVQRMKVSIDTNVAMARGWAQRQEMLGNVLSPGQELYRQRNSRVPRNWAQRWQDAAEAVGWEGVARGGQMIALVTSPIWVELSAFGNPYPPFDYNSGMRVRPVDFEVCEELGLVRIDDIDALEEEMEAQKESLNADVQASVAGIGEDLIDAVMQQLGGLVRRVRTEDGDVLEMTDPNGTKPCKWDEVGEVITAPLPNGFDNDQARAFEKWIRDSKSFAPPDKREGAPPATLDEIEDMNRLIKRIEPTEKNGRDDSTEDTMLRGLRNASEDARAEFLKSIKKNGYGVRAGFIAESWSGVMRTAKEFSSSPAPMVLVCEKYRSRKRVDGIYRHVDDMSPAPHKPKRIEGESLFAANVRFRYLRDELKDGVLYVYVEEI